MIFIVRDEHNESRDKVSYLIFPVHLSYTTFQMIAKHIMNIHMNRPNLNGDENGNSVGEIDLDKMKSYIAYCKRCKYTHLDSRVTSNISQPSKCAPRLSAEAQEMLSSHFVSLRKEVQKVEQDNDERSSIPITIRFVYFLVLPFYVDVKRL